MSKPNHQLLLNMMSYRRPNDSDMESDFVQKFIITPYVEIVKLMGPMRNVVITIGEGSKTLFSCHTDTVHRSGGFQEVKYDPHTGYAFKGDKECLGADDTTGVWLMLHMIKNDVPGTYVFHRGEECGGIGSRWIANNEKDFLKQFNRAIAFDRKGETSVITRQRGRQCCSDIFAEALCKSLGEGWEKDPGGSFTDTANYTADIPECTNLSIGYYDQHTGDETQNVDFAMELAERLCQIDWETLPTVREAKEEVYSYQAWGVPGTSRGFRAYDDWDVDDIYTWRGAGQSSSPAAPITGVKQSGAKEKEVVKGVAVDDKVVDINIRALKNRTDTSGLSVFDSPPEDYDNLSDSDLRGLSLRELIAICRDDPYFGAVKLRELLDENVSVNDTNRELNALLLELDEECVQLRLDYDTLEEQNKDLQKRYDKLDKEHLELERKCILKLPDWRSGRRKLS